MGEKMKTLTLVAVGCLLATTAFAEMSKDEMKRLGDSAVILNELRGADNGIPEDYWAKAQCVVVIPSMKKAAFVFGGEYGSGVMSCRRDQGWSAPVFMQLAKGSWGLQIGAEQIDLVLLVLNRRGVDKLLADKVSLGADASIAAGPVGRSANAGTDAQLTAEMLAYSRAQGLFAGINLSGGVLRPDKEAIDRAYGPDVSASQVIESARSSGEASAFLRALSGNVRSTTGQR
jgi:SH3 domain-containing YSC84-like protein 1